jgi:hypothetical protein
VKGKLLKKARAALTGTDEQNLSVLSSLAEEIQGDESFEPEDVVKYRLPEETSRAVTTFYLSDQISRSSPNVSDYVIVKVDGQKF